MVRPLASIVLLLLALASAGAYAQPVSNAEKSRISIESGIKHFNAREYSAALKDFKESYDLLPTALAAALAAQAQANVDESHTSIVVSWLAKAVEDASAKQNDAATWSAMARAINAALASASELETSVGKLAGASSDLKRVNAGLTEEIERLRTENERLKHKVSWFQSALPEQQILRLNKEMCARGDCAP